MAQRKYDEEQDYHHSHMMTGLFNDRDSAESAYKDALKRGYKPEDINVVMSEETRKRLYDSDLLKLKEGTKGAEGLGAGSAIGGTIGGIIGALAAIGTSLVIPGLGLVIAGPLAAGLAGAGAGGITGGLLGGLIGLGIPETTAKAYEKGIKNGGIVLGVNRNDHAADLEKDWKRHNPEDIR